MKNQSTLLAGLHDVLALNCYKSDFGEIAQKVKRLKQPERLKLIRLCSAFFDNARLRMHEPTKVAISKVCIALLPDSLNLIKKWLRCKSGRGIYEVHFSLFVFSYEIQNFKHLNKYKKEFLKLMELYLMHGKAETSQAVWMVGESLGDDWSVSESLPILLKTIRQAPHAIAREAALHGLSHVITRASSRNAKLICNTIEQVAKNESVKRIRLKARSIICHSPQQPEREGVRAT